MDDTQQYEFDILCIIDKICRKHDIKYILCFGTLIGAVRHQGFIPWDDDIDIAMLRADYEKFCLVATKELPAGYVLQNNRNEKEYFSALPKVRNTAVPMAEYAHRYLNISTGVWVDIFIYDEIPDETTERNNYLKDIYKLHNRIYRNLFVYASKHERGIKATVKRLIDYINKFKYPYFRKYYQKLFNQLTIAQLRYSSAGNKDCTTFCLRNSLAQYESYTLKVQDFYDVQQMQFEGGNFPVPVRFHEILTKQYGDYMVPPPPEERTSVHNLIGE